MTAGTGKTDQTAAGEHCPGPAILDFVARSRLVPPGVRVRLERLPGGVSSDIWLVRAGSAAFCVKRALPQLRVAAEWRAPVERNTKEAAWIKAVAGVLPQAVPRVLAEDAGAGMFAMEYLPQQSFEGWKAQLRRGHVSSLTAAEVARRLVTIHGRFAGRSEIEAEFCYRRDLSCDPARTVSAGHRAGAPRSRGGSRSCR